MAQPVQVSAPPPPTDAALPGAASHGINRDTDSDRETGIKYSPTRSGRLCLSDSLGLQNGWWLTPSGKLEALEQVCSRGTLQGGRFSYGQGSSELRGLVDHIGSERCLLLSTSGPQSPEVSPISMAGSNIQVSLPFVWPIMCIPYIHKTNETSSGISEGERNQMDYIPGQHIDPLQLSGHLSQSDGIHQELVSSVEPNRKQEEIPVNAIPEYQILGPGSIINNIASDSTQREDFMDPARGQMVICQDRGVCSKAGSLCGHDDGSKTGNSGGSTIPPGT